MRPGIKVTPSIVIASVALVVAASGSAYAAATIGSAQIVDDSVKSVDIKDESLGSRDITDGSIKSSDVLNDSLYGFDIANGSIGAEDLKPGVVSAPRWLLVDATGQIVAQSGGFSVASAYDAPGAPAGAVGNVYIDANEDLSDNGIAVTVALQNQVDQNQDTITNGRNLNPDANPEFSGEISASLCNFTGATGIPTNCAPADAQNSTSFVVSPRLSDGQVTSAQTRKRFYVTISGDSSDLSSSIPAVALPANQG